MSLSNANKANQSGFETQRRHHHKSKTRVSMTPQKGLMTSKIKKYILQGPKSGEERGVMRVVGEY